MENTRLSSLATLRISLPNALDPSDSASQGVFGYRKRESHPSRFGSRTGHESCPFIRLLSVRSIAIDTSLGEISMTLVMTMAVEYLAVAKGISSPLTLWDKMIDFPDISILEDESTVPTFPLLIFE